MNTTEEECVRALRRAADRLGKSPTKSQYEDLDVTPASTTIRRIIGGWNEAKERAGLETFTQAENGGFPVQSKPEGVEIPADREWTDLSPQQRWYYKNRSYRIERKEARRRRIQKWLTAYKRANCSCERCPESHPVCLDFHHDGEKTLGVAQMANHGYSKERILDEMDGCSILCANCHRKEHYNSEGGDLPTPREDAQARAHTADKARAQTFHRAWLDRYKRRSDGCARCPESDPACLDFHHTGPKTMGIAQMASRRWSLRRIQNELGKCELLCANCHRREHHGT